MSSTSSARRVSFTIPSIAPREMLRTFLPVSVTSGETPSTYIATGSSRPFSRSTKRTRT